MGRSGGPIVPCDVPRSLRWGGGGSEQGSGRPIVPSAEEKQRADIAECNEAEPIVRRSREAKVPSAEK